MKKFKIIALIVTTVFAFSCGDDFLSPDLTSAISSEDFYANDADLEAGLINMYDGIQGVNSYADSDKKLYHGIQIEFYVTEIRSDNTGTKSQEGLAYQFESFNIETTNTFVSDYYKSFYNVIFRANTVLDNLDVASAENRDKIEAEAKFVRAYAYFNLVRLFGDIPLIDTVITPAEQDISYTRVAASEIYDLIISDLQTAVDSELDNSSNTRASKAAAQTLLAKVYLTLGINYLDAQILIENVMDSGFTLKDDFKDVFYSERNSEIIFAIGFEPDNSNDSQDFSSEWLNAVGRTTGVNYVTEDVKLALDEMGGDRIPYSYREDPIQPQYNQVVKYLPTGDEDLGIPAVSSNARLAGNDWIVLRYADVLLLHVEAIMAGGQETSVGAALNSFQLVRNRAGLTDTVTNITKQELLDERRVELAFENHRFFDLVRFGEAQNVLSTFSTENGFGYSATDLLLPIPQGEINLSNGMLQQNPGY